MYTLPKDTEITAKVLNDIIAYNDKIKSRYRKLSDYYMGKHDILDRKKTESVMNNKVMINHARYITDTNVGYLLGNQVDYQVNDDVDIEPLLDTYNRQVISDLDSEIAKSLSIYGIQHEYIYVNENAEPKSCEIDNENAVVVYDDTVEHNKLFGVVYREINIKNKRSYYETIVIDDKNITTYKLYKTKTEEIDSKPHMFGGVPLIEYKNNPEYLGDFENVITLIDAYNLLQSDRINDKEQLVDAIFCLYGMDFDTKQAEQLKESRMIANIPTDGKAEYLIKTLQEADVDILRKNIERDIHKISMTPNMSDENFVGNSSGVALRYKLLAFEQNIKNKSRYMEKGLKERFRLYNNFLSTNSKMEIVPLEEVDVIFTRNLPSNDFEISQMINNLADFIDKETLISQLSFIKDAKDIIEAKENEDKEVIDKDFKTDEIPDANEGIEDEIE
jgi:SPP1 family phage portal protein